MTIDQRLRSAAEEARERVRHLDVPPLAPRRPGWVVAVATGAAVLIVAAAVWLLGLAANDEPPVVDSVPSTVATPPLDVEALPNEPGTWTVETSLGTWSWTRLDGAVGTLPGSGFFYADGAYWSLDLSWTPEGVLQGQQLWRSDDGVTWAKESVPAALQGRDVALSQAGDGLWAIDYSSSQVLRHVGEMNWELIDIRSMPLPSIEGLQWSTGTPRQVVTSGATSIATVFSTGSIDFDSIFAEALPTWDRDSHTVTLSEWNGETPDRTLDVEVVTGDREELRFIDPGTGEVVMMIDATGTGVIADQLTEDAQDWRLLVDDGAGFVEVTAPWGAYPMDRVEIADAPEGFLAVGFDGGSWSKDTGSVVYTWRSTDGLTWEEQPVVDAPTGADFIELRGGPGNLLLVFSLNLGTTSGGELWKTMDGANWESASLALGEGSPNAPGATSWGWAIPGLAPYGVNGGEMWPVSISTDGVDWEKVGLAPGLSPDDGMVSTGALVVNDLVFATRELADGTRHLWIGGLQP